METKCRHDSTDRAEHFPWQDPCSAAATPQDGNIEKRPRGPEFYRNDATIFRRSVAALLQRVSQVAAI